MKKMVVVGGGPIGLYMAIQLKKMGQDVTIIDPRAGEYTRPGDLNLDVFTELSVHLGHTITPSKSKHIKDVERSLYEIAQDLKIDIKKQAFEHLINNGIETKDVNGNTHQMHCDLLFDSTGSNRKSVNDLNKRTPFFHIQPIANVENPIKQHFIAYVEMQPHHQQLIKNPNPASLKEPGRTLRREKLRKLGWMGWDEPEFRCHITDPKKNKVCLYFEIPDKLSPKNYEQWLTTLLQFKSADDAIEFQHTSPGATPKPRFNAFTVNPQKVAELLYPGDDLTPGIIPLGDAQIDPDYRIGIGIKNGIQRANAFLNALEIDPISKEIVGFQIEKYKSEIAPLLLEYETELNIGYSQRIADLKEAEKNAEYDYQEALKLCTDPNDREIIKSALDKLYIDKATQLYENGLNLYKTTVDKNNNIAIDRRGNFPAVQLENSEKYLYEALTILKNHPINEDSSKLSKFIAEKLLNMASKYLDLAKNLFPLNQFHESEKILIAAIGIFQKVQPDVQPDTQMRIYHNLAILAHKRKGYDDALKWSDAALKKLESTTLPPAEKNLLHAKMTLSKASALFNGLIACVNKGIHYNSSIQQWQQEANLLLNNLSNNPHINKNELTQLLKSSEMVNQYYAMPDMAKNRARR